jgi:hypothetical protein
MTDNSNSNVPNTPEELLALNKNRSADPTETCGFLGALEEAVEEWQPEMNEVVNSVELLLMKLARWHYDTIESGELPEYSKTIWTDDLNSIKKALRNLRAVERQ